ncbi:DegT/DnrJ/EryC1/StrS family aminotransferase [Svornostia abyssi]|uniref:DegT/DnrJ/EryC1/StrS family aminotransferase n=1 Tax=Svornostia abyssi TaxID=2898438 RepID=A0ABY5PJH7_9ACTN|nr:DegT/DnrJ/EryC1/StrS family aminotransferase [Parviterribacteraceae bacterium J379]
MAVPLFDPAAPLAPLDAELRAAVSGVLDAKQYILGPNVTAFEDEFAAWHGVPHAIGVANGTEAITIALRALGVGPGDEVVVPSFTFYASAEAIPPTGATPVFCDVDPETYLVTAETVKAALTPRTKAVIAVHLFGNVAPVEEIAALGVPVLEDAAQSTGSKTTDGRLTGALGTIGTFSFYPSKNVGCFGDGGAIITSDAELAEHVRSLRFHGSRDKVTYEEVGYNSRLDEIQAAVLRVQLPHVHAWCDRRRQVDAWYAEAGLGAHVDLPVAAPGADPAWNLFVVGHDRADELHAALNAAGIGARSYYRQPVHEQVAMARWRTDAPLPGTARAAARHLAIPMGAALTRDDVDEVVAAVARATV